MRVSFSMDGVRDVIFGWVVFLWLGAIGDAAPLKVAALHPLLADLARQVGGDRTEVFDVVGADGNPHRFEPRPADMRRMQESSLVLASGKNLEPYLDRLRGALTAGRVLEVGQTIPSLTAAHEMDCGAEPGDHHVHAAGALDPHWWHGVEAMRRAARVVAQAMAEQDAAGADYYMGRAMQYGQRLDALKRWAKRELAKVPRTQRKLVTAHHAFGYFAQEFGFEVIAVAGLNKEQNTTPQDLAETIAMVKRAGVRAVFPETHTSAKMLDAIAEATGTRVGSPLIADGNGSGEAAGFEGMIRHNVNAITHALCAP